MNNELDYDKIVQLADTVSVYAEGVSVGASEKDFTVVRKNFAWLKTFFDSLEEEVKA